MSSTAKALWFHHPTAMSQPLFSVPVLGFITGSQAVILLGLGLPALFIGMEAGGIGYGAAAFCAIGVFSMIRPPVMGYEMRIITLIMFHLTGGSRKKQKKSGKGKKSKKKAPSALRGKAKEEKPARKEEARRPETESMEVSVSGNMPVNISLSLGSDHARRKVRVLIDDGEILMTVADDDGRLSVILDPEDCVGEHVMSVVAADAGTLLLRKNMKFKVGVHGA